jgi:hypothetical protein
MVVQNSSATPSEDNALTIHSFDGVSGADPLTFGTQSDNNYQVWASDQSDKSSAVFTDSNEQATTSLEFWTIKLGTSGSSFFYRNGDTSDGTTTGLSKSHGYNLDTNNIQNLITIGHGNMGWTGRIYEILVYNEELSNALIGQIEHQLKQKYI